MTKYGNKKTVYDDIVFDSIAEMRRYKELKLRESVGEIIGLELQPKFELQPAYTDRHGKKHRAIVYIADFFYYELYKGSNTVRPLKWLADDNGVIIPHTLPYVPVVEDVKGIETAVFKLKWKMLQYRDPRREYRIVK